MKFRYYITDTNDGCIKGTDDKFIARNFATSEEYFVVDTKFGKWLTMSDGDEIRLEKIDIEEMK